MTTWKTYCNFKKKFRMNYDMENTFRYCNFKKKSYL